MCWTRADEEADLRASRGQERPRWIRSLLGSRRDAPEEVVATLPGRSKTITVEPVEVPQTAPAPERDLPPEREPERTETPAKEPAPVP